MVFYLEEEYKYYMKSINATPGYTHKIDQLLVYDRVLQLYESKAKSVILEYPMYIKFVSEAGVDEGGVQRDMYTAFRDNCYLKLFEGVIVVSP